MAIQRGITGLEPILAGLGTLAEGLGRSVRMDDQRMERYRNNPQLLALLAQYANRASEEGPDAVRALAQTLDVNELFVQDLAAGMPESAQVTEAEATAKANIEAGNPQARAATEAVTLEADREQGSFLTNLFSARSAKNLPTLQADAEAAASLTQRLGSEMTAENIADYREYINSMPRSSRERLHAVEALTNPSMLQHRDRLAQMDLQAQLSYLSRTSQQEQRPPNSLERYEVWKGFQNRVEDKIIELRTAEEERGLDDPETRELIAALNTQFEMGQRLINDGFMDAVPLVTVEEMKRWFGTDLKHTWVAYGDAERLAAQMFANGEMNAEQWQRALGTARAEDEGRARRMLEYLADFKSDEYARQKASQKPKRDHLGNALRETRSDIPGLGGIR